jgi:hypothetical protein
VAIRNSRCATRHSWTRGFSFAPPTTILTWRRESRRWFRGRSSSRSWEQLTGVLDGFDWRNVVAANGGVAACLDPAKDASAPGQQGRPKDVDLFVYG